MKGRGALTGLFCLAGAGATVVATVAGWGIHRYALRLLSGYLTDQTKRYWTITLIGYALNLFAVPCWLWPGAGKLPWRLC